MSGTPEGLPDVPDGDIACRSAEIERALFLLLLVQWDPTLIFNVGPGFMPGLFFIENWGGGRGMGLMGLMKLIGRGMMREGMFAGRAIKRGLLRYRDYDRQQHYHP